MIALVRKIIPSKSYYLSLPGYVSDYLDGGSAYFTFISLEHRWGERVSQFHKAIGKSRIYNSLRIIVPKDVVVKDLGLEDGGHVWVGVSRSHVDVPGAPFIREKKTVHYHGSGHFIVISKRYADKVRESAGIIDMNVVVRLDDFGVTVHSILRPSNITLYYIPIGKVSGRLPSRSFKSFTTIFFKGA